MTPAELTKAAMSQSEFTSTRLLGRHLKVSHMKVHSWLQNEICPSFEMAYALAELAGLPGVETAANVRQHSSEGKKHISILRRIAQSSMAASLSIMAVYAPISHSQTAHEKSATSYTLCEL